MAQLDVIAWKGALQHRKRAGAIANDVIGPEQKAANANRLGLLLQFILMIIDSFRRFDYEIFKQADLVMGSAMYVSVPSRIV